MIKIRIPGLGVLIGCLLVLPLATAQAQSPDSILRWIKDSGATSVLVQMDAVDGPCPARACNPYYLVLDSIGTGTQRWLRVAELLGPAAEGGDAEEMTIALATVLPNAPRGVLRILVPNGGHETLSVAEVCRAPFVEPTRRFLRHYYARTLGALQGVRDRSLMRNRDLCLAALQGALAPSPKKS